VECTSSKHTAAGISPLLARNDIQTLLQTLEFDCMLDTFFLLDILYQFFVGVIINTDYIDDPVEVAKRYAKGALIFDMATSIPVSYLELQVALACGKSGGSEHGGSG
jgi:hypothetical protein